MMQKRKRTKIKKQNKFNDENASGEYMTEMMNDFILPSGDDNATDQLASATMSSAIDLAKLVILII